MIAHVASHACTHTKSSCADRLDSVNSGKQAFPTHHRLYLFIHGGATQMLP